MLGSEVERLPVDERLEHRLHASAAISRMSRHGQIPRKRHRAVGRLADARLAGSVAREDELGDRRLRTSRAAIRPRWWNVGASASELDREMSVRSRSKNAAPDAPAAGMRYRMPLAKNCHARR